MAKLPVLKPRALEQAGFYVHHQRGSHARLLHRTDPARKTVIPVHSKDLPPSLLRRILKQAAIEPDEFITLL